jgi:beta-N-acetylglucosaminidase
MNHRLQSQNNVKKANEHRLAIFELKKRYKNRTLDPAEAIDNKILENMSIGNFLRWNKRVDFKKSENFLNKHLISFHRPIGLLTTRQKDIIIKQIDKWREYL